jgi:hypothetical protein
MVLIFSVGIAGLLLAAPLWVNPLLSGLSMAPIQTTASFSMAGMQSTAAVPATSDNLISALKPYLAGIAFAVLVGLLIYAWKNSSKRKRR